MHLAYSALRLTSITPACNVNADDAERLKAYQLICEKYRQEITAIRKYFPDWQPVFETRSLNK